MQIPSHLKKTTFDLEVGGHTYRFYAISADVLAQVLDAGAPIRQAAEAAFESGDMGPLLRQVQEHSELAATVVLDALHEEAWVSRPITGEDARAFAAATDEPTRLSMLTAAAAVNARAWRPFAEGLRAMGEALADPRKKA